MFEYAIPVFAFVFGLVFIWQGVRRLQGKRGTRPDALTRMMLPSMSEGDQEKTLKVHQTTNKVQGALRIAFGLFVMGMGVYYLLI
jgi:hypothetical protein